jgi:hypothetical protein
MNNNYGIYKMAYVDLDTKSCISTVTSGTGAGTETTCNDPLNIGCTYDVPNTYAVAGAILLGIIILSK